MTSKPPFPRAAPLVAIVLFAGCFSITTQEERYDPFVVSRDTVLRTVTAIVVTPIVPPEGVFVSEEAAQRVTAAVETQLRNGGFSVVPAEEYSRIWDGIIRQVGGFFDPLTGERDEQKFENARQELLRELQGRFHTQVMLYAELEIVDAYVDGGVAEWDGAEHDISGQRTAIAAAYQDTFEQDEIGGIRDGVVSAVSLVVVIDGQDGREMYRNFGGLEVVARRTGVIVQQEGDFALRAEPQRVAWAAARALGPLTGARGVRAR
jgi:hypothetical protein